MNKCCKKELAHLAKWEYKLIDLEKDLQRLVDMHWDYEKIHWEEEGTPEEHIFHAFNNIKNYLIGRKDD